MPTSIAKQTAEQLGGTTSVLTLQKHDHIRLERLLQELAGTPPERQPDVLRRINRLVFSHAFAEEAVLWPTLRRRLSDGEQLTLEVEREHQQINEVVAALEHAGPTDPQWDPLLRRLVGLLREDVRDEEDVLLPRLQDQLSPHQLRRLGWRWAAVRRTAPTRPHPAVSRRPPGNVASAPPLSVLDRLRDGLEATSQRTSAPVSSGLRAVADALGRAAGRLEALPGLRRGEQPETRRGPRA